MRNDTCNTGILPVPTAMKKMEREFGGFVQHQHGQDARVTTRTVRRSMFNVRCSMFLLSSLLILLSLTRAADAPALPYTQNFDKLPEGEPPEEIQILDGEFVIKKVDGNMLLEMGPDPLKPSGILVGPADKNEYQVTARIKTTNTGKRFNEFGIGTCGPNQFKLWLMPAVGELQLLNGDDVEAKAAYKWESGVWTKFKLSVSKIEGMKFKIQGKAWAEGKEEPKEWLVSYESVEAPRPGRASLWSTPYAGTATQFDDVVVEAVGK